MPQVNRLKVTLRASVGILITYDSSIIIYMIFLKIGKSNYAIWGGGKGEKCFGFNGLVI